MLKQIFKNVNTLYSNDKRNQIASLMGYTLEIHSSIPYRGDTLSND